MKFKWKKCECGKSYPGIIRRCPHCAVNKPYRERMIFNGLIILVAAVFEIYRFTSGEMLNARDVIAVGIILYCLISLLFNGFCYAVKRGSIKPNE